MPRIAIVHKDKCNPQGCGGYLCIRVCPENRMGKECIVMDPEDKKVKINENQCGTGVQIAVNRCPFEALEMINIPDELAKRPIHKFYPNGFHLYNLPTPTFGKVTGIVGRNGIGKSTAMKILAGSLKPNLGKEEATYEELLEFFKGTEAQNFFEHLREGTVKVSYKPQQVENIPKTVKGTVRELLQKVDERNALDEAAEQLQLQGVLDRKIDVLSGGELQRVAIAAAALKKANVYMFDEPTSFLDIKQRMAAAKYIKSLANEETSVLVIDHDLIILDYMTDLIHIMYGKEACYGIVSLQKPTRSALNTFLDGYIREQNMRFRDYRITFEEKPPGKAKKFAPLTEWDEVQLKLGKFSLKADKGAIHKQEVVGILGENGIGKTTFVKVLAGVVEPDKGQPAKVKVGYKPQYLEAKDAPVSTMLQNAIAKYEIQLIRPLELKHLLTKNVEELSGGELQRVAIAYALSQEADLYLLDEPSAYLDVEQRMAVAKMIKEVATARGCSILVVDHDLLFMDYLAERLSVFEGEPAQEGHAKGPFQMEEGMNKFLESIAVTLRRDHETRRPRMNKPGSVHDREQKTSGKYYYA